MKYQGDDKEAKDELSCSSITQKSYQMIYSYYKFSLIVSRENMRRVIPTSDAIESMMYDHFLLNSSNFPDIVAPTSSISSTLVSSSKKKVLPVTTATRSETTANSQTSGGSKFMSWMIHGKRAADQNADSASVSSKKSSSSASSLKEDLAEKKFLNVDAKKLYDYAAEDLYAFGRSLPATCAASESTNKTNNTTTTSIATVASNSSNASNGTASSITTTTAPLSSITSINSTIDNTTGLSQKPKVTEIFEKSNPVASKTVEKEK